MSCWVRPSLISCYQKRQEEMIWWPDPGHYLWSSKIILEAEKVNGAFFGPPPFPLWESLPGLVKMLWPKMSTLIRTLFLFAQAYKKHLLYDSRLGGLHRETMIGYTATHMTRNNLFSNICSSLMACYSLPARPVLLYLSCLMLFAQRTSDKCQETYH